MKKIILMTAITLIVMQGMNAQNKGFVGISLGAGIPAFDYASQNALNSKAGLAKLGSAFDLSLGYKLHSKFGVTALLRGQYNPYDADAVASEATRQQPTLNWTVENKSHLNQALLLGGFGSFRIKEKVFFEPRAMAGVLNAYSPQYTLTASNGLSSATIKAESKSNITFCYLLGVGVRFDINDKLTLLTNIDYTSATVTYNNLKTTIGTTPPTISYMTVNQTIDIVTIGIGLAIRL